MSSKLYLIIGAGAVGRPFGFGIARAGGRVAFLARKGSKKPAQADFPLVEARSGKEEHLEARWHSEMPPEEDLAAILICIRADQLDGALSDFGSEIAARKSVPVVFFQPAFHDREKIEKACPGVPLVQGNPGILSYFEGEAVHYWVPPAVKTVLGPISPKALDAAGDLAALMSRGGFGAKVVKDVPAAIHVPFAFAMPILAAFEHAGFSWDALLADRSLLKKAAETGREAAAIARTMVPQSAPWTGLLPYMPAGLLAFLLPLGMRFLDDFTKTMWRVHATKLTDQTRAMIGELIGDGKARNLPTAKLEALRAQVWGG